MAEAVRIAERARGLFRIRLGADLGSMLHRLRLLLGALLLASLALSNAGDGVVAPSAEVAAIGADGSMITLTGSNFALPSAVMFGQPGQEVVVPSSPRCGTKTVAGCIVQQTAAAIVVKAPPTCRPASSQSPSVPTDRA